MASRNLPRKTSLRTQIARHNRPISANSVGVAWRVTRPHATTILHNDSAVRKRFLYQLINDVRSSGQTELLNAALM
jgi:hypothetical protein